MATIEEGLRANLLANTAVTAITGIIRPDDMAEQDAMPAVVIDIQSERRDTSLDGMGGLVHADVAIHCLTDRKQTSRALAEAVRSGLEGWSGTSGSIEFHVEEIGERSLSRTPLGDESNRFQHDVTLMATVAYSE